MNGHSAGVRAEHFTDRVAVITGALGEIGLETAEELARRGATVWAADIGFSPSEPSRPVGAGIIHPVNLDVTDSHAVDSLFRSITSASGPISMLVNAAGGPGTDRSPVEDVTDAQWKKVVSLNLDGTFYCCRAAVKSMKSGGIGGSIVNISSGAGRTYSRTGVQAYAAAKAGVIGLTRQLAREMGTYGVRVNCVAPGLIAVEGLAQELSSISSGAMQTHLSGVALGRLGSAADLVGPIVFFLGPQAGYVTGQTISVDGGSTMLG
ncbi:SDR family NAD(P)-dependent oxidoreductase [Arthrobacter sp. efr-133-TYG-118]|uniref:SDR family NAD(P)-dependent oxidoreductase n=1 Tax=Arthrobacter sp. efr-133-TYG-118 TaxID=3040279 RepID=UPI00254DB612|nr:SDR family NAD(P)-dependent oxidoreductase [Arthrobacter sp. efr-133-TYG-118]